jgi:Ca-activated chloride channel family protein
VSLSLLWPWGLLAAPLPWLLCRWLPPAPPTAEALCIPDLEGHWIALPPAWRAGAAAPPTRRLGLALWVLLLLAWAEPVWMDGAGERITLAPGLLLLALPVAGALALAARRRPRRYRALPGRQGP